MCFSFKRKWEVGSLENRDSGKMRENSFNPYFITGDTIRKISGEFKLVFALTSLLLILNEIQIYF